jgi:hypothetical protein
VTVRGYRLALDWSRAGTYAGAAEDVSGYLSDDDLEISVGRETSQAGADLSATTLAFSMLDTAKVYAPASTTSVIAGKVLPGVPAVFDVTISGATTTLYNGVLDDFEYDVSVPDAPTLTGTVTDAWGIPGAESLSTPVYQGKRTGELIGLVLDAIGWTGPRDLDVGATVVPYWWAEGKDAATAIQEIVDSEGPPAIAYVEAGTFVFKDRHHRMTDAASMTSQSTYTHTVPAGAVPGDFKILKGSFKYQHGLKNIVNSATFQVDIRQPVGLDRVWSSDSPLTIAANTSITLFIQADEPFINAQTPTPDPVLHLDDGSIVPDYVLDGGSITVTLDRTSGQSLAMTLTAGGTDAIVLSLALRAASLPVARTVKVSAEDGGSVLSKGRLSWPRSLPWAGPYDAQAIADRIVSAYAVSRPVLTFTIEGILSTAYLQEFAARKVSDRITVRHDIVGLNTDFIVEKVIRTVKALGKIGTQLTLVCEVPDPTGAVNPLTFNAAGKGFNDGQFQAVGIDNPTTVFRFDVAGQGFNQGRFAS